MEVPAKAINVKIIKLTTELVKVKLPFLDVPMEMSRDYFSKYLDSGYFKISNVSKLRLFNKKRKK
jgi:hypothetical protein